MNIAIITLDSLRFDVAITAKTPNLDLLFLQQKRKWELAYAQGTFTLPSHIAILKAGKLPDNRTIAVPLLNHGILSPFKLEVPWNSNRKALYNLPLAENIVRAHQLKGFQTIGIGGGWLVQ